MFFPLDKHLKTCHLTVNSKSSITFLPRPKNVSKTPKNTNFCNININNVNTTASSFIIFEGRYLFRMSRLVVLMVPHRKRPYLAINAWRINPSIYITSFWFMASSYVFRIIFMGLKGRDTCNSLTLVDTKLSDYLYVIPARKKTPLQPF